jgi:hypothetical protein
VLKPSLLHLLQELVSNGISRITVCYGYNVEAADSNSMAISSAPMTSNGSVSDTNKPQDDIAMLITSLTQQFLYEPILVEEDDYPDDESSLSSIGGGGGGEIKYEKSSVSYSYQNSNRKKLLEHVRFLVDTDIQSDAVAMSQTIKYLCSSDKSSPSYLYNNNTTTMKMDTTSSLLVMKGEIALGNLKSKRSSSAFYSFLDQAIKHNQQIHSTTQMFITAVSYEKELSKRVTLAYTRDVGDLISSSGSIANGLYSEGAVDEGAVPSATNANKLSMVKKKRKTTEFGTPFFGVAIIPNTKALDYANRIENTGVVTFPLQDLQGRHHPVDAIISNIMQQNVNFLNLEELNFAMNQSFVGVPITSEMFESLSTEKAYRDAIKRVAN